MVLQLILLITVSVIVDGDCMKGSGFSYKLLVIALAILKAVMD